MWDFNGGIFPWNFAVEILMGDFYDQLFVMGFFVDDA